MASFPITYSDQAPETKEDAIICVAAYDRKDHRKWVIHFPDSEHEQICLELDVESCFRFRQVNRYAREAVTDLRAYRAVATHALDCFAALLRTEIGWIHTFQDVYAQLCTQECQRCGTGFGTFLYLPTLARRCRLCDDAIEYRDGGVVPVTLNSLAAKSGISKAEIRRMGVPVVRTLRGKYTIGARDHRRRVCLVDNFQALDIMERSMGKELQEGLRRWYGPLSLNELTLNMAMVKFPFYVPSTDKAYHGVNCAGCAVRYEVSWDLRLPGKGRFQELEEVHTRSGFLEHFKKCAAAEYLWVMSKQGSVPFDRHIPRIVKNGGPSLVRAGWV
ncbi:hypothetical protein GE09DRAFT_1170693 [Coniochaeta sp. 2T2.1]|nr:hypothetical protein GE09DRAFT_1170693 [Coniochaeta sp. 2T2.1]